MLALQLATLSCILAYTALAFPNVQIRETKASLPFAGRLNVSGSRLPDIDRARAAQHKTNAKFSSGTKRQTSSVDITNEAVTYVADVGVGSPATTYSLLIDTGSSNTWVGAGQAYVRTSTSQATGELSEITYGSGFFFGNECRT